MQDPKTGQLEPLDSLDDPKRRGKEHWRVYKVGERVRFRGWWWEIAAVGREGLQVRPVRRASKDDIEILERELKRLKKRERSGR